MSTQSIVSIFLPLSLAIIMLGFGLSLSPDDFKRVLKYPRSVMVGLFCQMALLPLLAFSLCYLFGFSPALSIGLMILAASPGGVAANIFSHLSHGDVALNLTLTAINCVLAAFTLPLVVNLSIAHFGGSEAIGLQFRKTIEVFLIVLVPVIIGMTIRKMKPELSAKADKPVRIFSILVLALITVVAVLKEKDQLMTSMGQIGIAMLVFNIGSMAIGYFMSMAFKLKHQEATAITMEVGIHNSTLALYIAMTVLGSFELAIPAAIYSIFMFMTAGAFSVFLIKKNK
ncbi:MAG: bile acid:sodium symporter family protein [Bdellovibrionota bacterium]